MGANKSIRNKRRVTELITKYNIDLNPMICGYLPIAKQQMVEIFKTWLGAELIIFDEPTSALAKEESINCMSYKCFKENEKP